MQMTILASFKFHFPTFQLTLEGTLLLGIMIVEEHLPSVW